MMGGGYPKLTDESEMDGWKMFFFNGSLQKGDMSMFILVVVVC